jgi:hypothetical protein
MYCVLWLWSCGALLFHYFMKPVWRHALSLPVPVPVLDYVTFGGVELFSHVFMW